MATIESPGVATKTHCRQEKKKSHSRPLVSFYIKSKIPNAYRSWYQLVPDYLSSSVTSPTTLLYYQDCAPAAAPVCVAFALLFLMACFFFSSFRPQLKYYFFRETSPTTPLKAAPNFSTCCTKSRIHYVSTL